MNLKKLVFSLLFSILFFSSNASFAGVKDGLNEQQWRNGQMIFELYCAVCHGYEGVPFNPRAPSFAKGERMGKSVESLLTSISKGLGAAPNEQGDPMPAWGEIITEQERKDVLYYIRKVISKGKVKK